MDILGPELGAQLSLDSVWLLVEGLSEDRLAPCSLLDRAVRKWYYNEFTSKGQFESYLTSQVRSILQFL